MSTSKDPYNGNGNSQLFFHHMLLLIPWVLIYLGDGIRLGIRLIWMIVSKSYKILYKDISLRPISITTLIVYIVRLPKMIYMKCKVLYISLKFFFRSFGLPYKNPYNTMYDKREHTKATLITVNVKNIRLIIQAYVEHIRTKIGLIAAREVLSIEKSRETKRMRIINMLTKRQMKRTVKILRHPFVMFLTGITFSCIFLLIPLGSYIVLQSLPNPHLLSERNLDVSTQMFDRNGVLLYEIYADENRNPLPLSDIPDLVKLATIAIEDREFYRHNGVSVRGILRSLKEILFNKTIQGGSTITQQLIKTAILSPEITLERKLKEILLSFWAERIYSKDQILEMYLNQVPYGGTAWGIETASQTFFGKSVRELSLAEISLIAGLPAAPSDYSPFGAHPEKAVERQIEVLRRMVEDRYITQKDMQEALSTKLVFAPQRTGIKAPHFVMYVKNQLVQKYGAKKVERGGLRITTTIDLSIQEKAEEIVKHHINSLSHLFVSNGAAIVTDPKTGEILAMIGSQDYFDTIHDGNVNVTTSLRQPGSSIKPVTYAAALENKQFTASSIIQDISTVFPNPGSVPYMPVNYDGRFHGPVPLRAALANSYNIPAVKVLQTIGLTSMIRTARDMGITSWNDEGRFGLSLTLGGGEVTMVDMARVYGAFANMGENTAIVSTLEVSDYTGTILETHDKPVRKQVLSEGTAFIISDILSDNFARSSAFGTQSTLVIPGKTAAVKTGTSNDKRDNWTIGYTPSRVVVVWVGNNDNSPMHPTLTSGITGASPIWHDIMTEVLSNMPDEKFVKPEGVVALPCYYGKTEYFLSGTEPKSGSCGPLPTMLPTPKPTEKENDGKKNTSQ